MVVVSERESASTISGKSASLLLAVIGTGSVALFAQVCLRGARFALERHAGLPIAAGLALLAALNAAILAMAIYRSPLIRGTSIRLLVWVVSAGWAVDLVLVSVLYGIPYY